MISVSQLCSLGRPSGGFKSPSVQHGGDLPVRRNLLVGERETRANWPEGGSAGHRLWHTFPTLKGKTTPASCRQTCAWLDVQLTFRLEAAHKVRGMPTSWKSWDSSASCFSQRRSLTLQPSDSLFKSFSSEVEHSVQLICFSVISTASSSSLPPPDGALCFRARSSVGGDVESISRWCVAVLVLGLTAALRRTTVMHNPNQTTERFLCVRPQIVPSKNYLRRRVSKKQEDGGFWLLRAAPPLFWLFKMNNNSPHLPSNAFDLCWHKVIGSGASPTNMPTSKQDIQSITNHLISWSPRDAACEAHTRQTAFHQIKETSTFHSNTDVSFVDRLTGLSFLPKSSQLEEVLSVAD